MTVCDHVDKFSRFHAAAPCEHMRKDGILAHVPVPGGDHVLGALVENGVQGQFLVAGLLRHIEGHAVGAGLQVHGVEVLHVPHGDHDAP